jgi:uncharacterized damage-inducible protein DinB
MNSLVAANLSCLEQGIELLEGLPRAHYSRSCEAIFKSSIGGHFRHNLDHYLAFLSGLESGEIDYDAREREPEVEANPDRATRLMRELMSELSDLGEADLDQFLRIRMDDGGDSTWSDTSLRRELQFLLSHTIHHYALIVAIAGNFGLTTFPDQFGIAPSTLHLREAQGA